MFSLLRGIEFGLLSSKFLVCAFIEISDKQKRMEENTARQEAQQKRMEEMLERLARAGQTPQVEVTEPRGNATLNVQLTDGTESNASSRTGGGEQQQAIGIAR